MTQNTLSEEIERERMRKHIEDQLWMNEQVRLTNGDISRAKKIIRVIRMPEGLLKEQAIYALRQGY